MWTTYLSTDDKLGGVRAMAFQKGSQRKSRMEYPISSSPSTWVPEKCFFSLCDCDACNICVCVKTRKGEEIEE